MAVKLYNPMRPLNEEVRVWMQQAEEELQGNFKVQRIYPTEIYQGWLKENQRRKEYAQKHPGKDVWYSTGQGVQSIQTKVVSASDPNNVTVAIFHLQHMMFADMGVGIWGDYEDIQHSRNAKPNRRYISAWVPSQGETHRPGIMFKAHTIRRRMENYMMNFYGLELEARFIQATTHMEKPFAII